MDTGWVHRARLCNQCINKREIGEMWATSFGSGLCISKRNGGKTICTVYTQSSCVIIDYGNDYYKLAQASPTYLGLMDPKTQGCELHEKHNHEFAAPGGHLFNKTVLCYVIPGMVNIVLDLLSRNLEQHQSYLIHLKFTQNLKVKYIWLNTNIIRHIIISFCWNTVLSFLIGCVIVTWLFIFCTGDLTISCASNLCSN